jgi:hypothetical protein
VTETEIKSAEVMKVLGEQEQTFIPSTVLPERFWAQAVPY